MFPIGTKVCVTSVEHLGRFRRPTRLIGRTGTVIAHLDDGEHEVQGLARIPGLPVSWVFPADAINPA
jgi:hypothetical protein